MSPISAPTAPVVSTASVVSPRAGRSACLAAAAPSPTATPTSTRVNPLEASVAVRARCICSSSRSPADLRKAGAAVARRAKDAASLVVDVRGLGLDGAGLHALAEGLLLASYSFSRKAEPKARALTSVTVVGADALQEILSWRSSEQLFELAEFVGCTRPGYAMDPGTLDGMPHDRVTIVEIPALAISSTDIRARAYEEKPVWYLVPDGVVQYMAKHRLYTAEEIDAI